MNRLLARSLIVLTQEQLGILQHALGLDQYGRGEMYRNHFCAGGKDEAICRELVALGFMKTFTRSYLPYYNCTVTEEGKAAVLAQSPAPPKLTRSQQRYRAYLNADTGESFRNWLRRGLVIVASAYVASAWGAAFLVWLRL
jgi:hypothetical protein